MKNFEELSKELDLFDSFENELGLMYQEVEERDDIKVVRYFYDCKLLTAYVDLYNFIKEWIETSTLKKYIIIPELIEIGKDFIIRRWFVYYVSIYRYFEEEDFVEPPSQFFEMKKELELIDFGTASNEILKEVLYNSLLKPTGKTYFDSELNKFIIVEPKISVKNLLVWKSFNI